MTTPFRIRLADPELRPAFLQSLSAGNCYAAPLADGSLEVVHRDARTRGEARLELLFFLRAWQSRYPHAAVELVD